MTRDNRFRHPRPADLHDSGKLAGTLTRHQGQLLNHRSTHFLDVLPGLPTRKLPGRSRRPSATRARSSAAPGADAAGLDVDQQDRGPGRLRSRAATLACQSRSTPRGP